MSRRWRKGSSKQYGRPETIAGAKPIEQVVPQDRQLQAGFAVFRIVLRELRMLKLRALGIPYGYRLRVGRGVALGPRCFISTQGEVNFGDFVRLGSDVHIEVDVSFGDRTMISSGVALIGNDHATIPGESVFSAPKSPGKVSIGKDCWIGYGAILVGDVTVGDSVIVGAGAVVTKDLLSPGVYVGVPARRLPTRHIREE